MDKLINLNLLFPNDAYVKYMKEVKATRVFDGTNVEEEGLYSEDIFGAIGSEVRMSRFGYIDLFTDIIHPLLYINLISLSSLYKKVIEGKAFVILKKGEYIEVPEEEGSTGFTYFLSTFKQLKLERNDSKERDEKIDLINKHAHPVYNKILVYPAGLRDFSVDRHGNIKEHEMVDYYVKIISLSKLVREYKHLGSDVDDILLKIQTGCVELYEYLFSLVDGKHKVIRKNFTSRYVDYGTFNVLTSTPVKIDSLDDDTDITATQMGMLQYIKSIDPIAKFALNRFIPEKCFSLDGGKARVFDSNYKSMYIEVSNKSRDLWTTQRGYDTIFNMAGKDEFLNTIVSIDEHYPIVLSEDKDNIYLYRESDSIPEGVEVRPLVYGEMLYFMLLEDDNHKKYPSLTTRHPVAGPNSIYVSPIKLNTTTRSLRKTIHFVEEGTKIIVPNAPVLGDNYMLGFTPPTSRLKGMGADHDGDKSISRVMFTEESIEELNAFMNSVAYFVNPDLTPTLDFDDDISKFVALTLTKK